MLLSQHQYLFETPRPVEALDRASLPVGASAATGPTVGIQGHAVTSYGKNTRAARLLTRPAHRSDQREEGIDLYASKYGMELAPVLRRLIHWAETKELAARLGVSVTWLERVARGEIPLPAAMLAPMVRELGAERGEELLHAVLDPMGLTWARRSPAEADLTGLKLAMVADEKMTAFERAAVAVEEGKTVPAALVQEKAGNLCNFITAWAHILCARIAEASPVKVARRAA